MVKKSKKVKKIKEIKKKEVHEIAQAEFIGIKKILKSKKSCKEKATMIWKRYSSQMGFAILFLWAIILLLIVFFVMLAFGGQQMQSNGLDLNGLGNKVEEEVIICEHNHPLTGECTDGEIPWEEQKVFAVMVENHFEARPQSGISKAEVVYEALVEGGITRYLLIYDNLEAADLIGPVRSARPYYLWWAAELDNALYGHVGGSPESLNLIQRTGMNDCDEFVFGKTLYHRSSDRRAPHNTYTSMKNLEICNDDADAGRLSEIESWKFMEVSDSLTDVKVQEIIVDYSTLSYKVNWQYNIFDKKYYRFYGNLQAQLDDLNNDQIKVNNVIVLEMPSRAIDDYGRLSMDSIGEGDAIIYRNGKKVVSYWVKEERTDRMKFFDDNGDEVELMPGNSWIQVVPDLNIISEK